MICFVKLSEKLLVSLRGMSTLFQDNNSYLLKKNPIFLKTQLQLCQSIVKNRQGTDWKRINEWNKRQRIECRV